MVEIGDELKAMGAIKEAMGGLDEGETRRVLLWAIDKYGDGLELGSGGGGRQAGLDPGDTARALQGGEGGNTAFQFERISDLMDEASPSNIVQYVLVGAYWFQQVQRNEDFTGLEVNALLKDLGHGSKNITDSFNSLINRKPPLARQVQKSGKSRQARKRYRLTNEGIRAVEKMLKKEDDES